MSHPNLRRYYKQSESGKVILLVMLIGTGIHATGDAQQQVFKGRIDLVRHEVTVIDNRTGKPVTGLTRGDLTISENGERQKITTFLAESESRSGAGFEAMSKDRRVFLLVFGTGRLEGPVDPFEGAIHFLRERLRPNDLVSVMAFNRATPLTSDHELVAGVVERLKLQAGALRLELLDNDMKSRFQDVDLSTAAQAAIDALFLPAEAAGTVRNATALLLGGPVLRQNVERWRRWNRLLVERVHVDCRVTESGRAHRWPGDEFSHGERGARAH